MSLRPRHAAALACLVVGLASSAQGATPAEPKRGPRPVSERERRGIELALDYAAQGPSAWLPALSPDSPLGKLTGAEAQAEIAARVGPAAGTTWTLYTAAADDGTVVFGLEYPSGLEETIVLSVEPVGEDGQLRLRDVRCLLDERAPDGPLPGHPRPAPSSGAPSGGGAAAPRAAGMAAPGAALALALLGLAGLGACRRPELRLVHRAVAATAIAGVVTLLAFACHDAKVAPAAPVASTGPARLGALAPLRAALAGTAPVDVSQLVATLPAEVARAGRIWQIADLLGRREYERARVLLAGLPSPNHVPMVSLLRGRLALFLGDAKHATEAFDEALLLGPDHDGLRLEAAGAELLAGEPGNALVHLGTAAAQGARNADVYYVLASLEMGWDDAVERAEAALRIAWSLAPVTRGRLFGDAFLAALAARPTAFPTFAFGATVEPIVRNTLTARGGPLLLPASAQARVAGSGLAITVGSDAATATEFGLAGAAALAPAGTPVEDAAATGRRQEERALARFAELVARGLDPASLATPHGRQQAEETAAALARHNRWSDAERLTNGLTGTEVATNLIRIRAQALLRLGRATEARDLMINLATREVALARRNPGTLVDLAELCAQTGEHQLAIRLLHKAQAIAPRVVRASRVRQLEAEAALLADGESLASKTFDLLYPKATGATYPKQLAGVLESERARLARLVPETQPPPRVKVQLYNFEQFMQNYSADGVPVIGIYDGKVRVPFADVPSLHPQLVSILSHEVTHAMIAEHTHDQAPHWFQEGLAQHLETSAAVVNPIPDLVKSDRILAFSVLEDVLSGFSEAQFVEIAYDQSAWFLHFLEARYGVAKIRGLLDAFAGGATTDEAILAVYGMPATELDRAFRVWGTDQAPVAWKAPQARRYDQEARLAEAVKAEVAPIRLTARAVVTPRARAEANLRDWHARYAASSGAVKRALGPVVQLYRHRVPTDVVAACGDLAASVRALRAESAALQSPLPGVAADLDAAYGKMAEVAAACAKGDDSTALSALFTLEQKLASAARQLAPYGLQP
jgi:tetratricopeptide (TPR) repeat protein